MFLMLMQVLWFFWMVMRFLQTRSQREEEIQRQAAEKVETALQEADSNTPDNLNVVARSVNDVVGTYKDLKIYRTVQLDDGRMFTFESVAVEQKPGDYHADDPSKKYIIVDKCLLYREIPVS